MGITADSVIPPIIDCRAGSNGATDNMALGSSVVTELNCDAYHKLESNEAVGSGKRSNIGLPLTGKLGDCETAGLKDSGVTAGSVELQWKVRCEHRAYGCNAVR